MFWVKKKKKKGEGRKGKGSGLSHVRGTLVSKMSGRRKELGQEKKEQWPMQGKSGPGVKEREREKEKK